MATNGPKKSIMQILEEDAARKIAKNPNSKSISEILQEEAAQHLQYQSPQMGDHFRGGNRHPGSNTMKIDYNHQRISGGPMYHSGPPLMPAMGQGYPPYHHPLPPNTGMYPPLGPPRQPMPPPGQPMPPHPMPPHSMPPHSMPPHSIPPHSMPPHSMPPHHPHMPPPMPPLPYPHMPPHPVHYMQPPAVPLPVTQNHHTYQHRPPQPEQKSHPPQPLTPVLTPAPPEDPPLPPLPPSEPPLPPPPKEPPPPSPVKKASVKHIAESASLSHNLKKMSPDAFNITSIPTIPLTRDKSIHRSSTSITEVRHSSSPHMRHSSSPHMRHSSSPQMLKSSPNTTPSLPNQSHYSSHSPMPPSKPLLNMGHPPHPPGGSGQHYHAHPPSDDLEEAMFSPTSSTDDSPVKEQAKEEDSLIDKYVRDFSTKSSTKSESEKSPSKKVSFAPDTKKESPIRIDLDARLKTMFGVEKKSSESTEDIPGKKKPPMPVRMDDKGSDTMESVPAIQTGSVDERPLSPPPSPFLSKEIYLYWHKETIRVRKASKPNASVDFVNAGSAKSQHSNSIKSRSHESVKGFELRVNGQQGSMPPPPPPKNLLPTVPPPSYKKLSQNDIIQGRNLKADSSLKDSSNVQYHPYKRIVDKTDDSENSLSKSSNVSNVNNNNSISDKKHSIHNNNPKLGSDSELELTCQNSNTTNKTELIKPIDRISKNENKVSVNTVETKNVPVVSDSFLKAKTVGLVMSKVLAELRQTIRQELVKKLLEDNIMDTSECGEGS